MDQDNSPSLGGSAAEDYSRSPQLGGARRKKTKLNFTSESLHSVHLMDKDGVSIPLNMPDGSQVFAEIDSTPTIELVNGVPKSVTFSVSLSKEQHGAFMRLFDAGPASMSVGYVVDRDENDQP